MSPVLGMSQAHAHEPIDGFIVKLVRFKTRQLVTSGAIPPCDRHDIEQDLFLDLLRRLPRFDAALSSRSTFVRRVVGNRISTLLRSRCAEGRDPARVELSLSDCVIGHDGVPVCRAETMDAERYGAGCRPLTGSSSRHRDLRLDAAAVLATLPAHLREICERLQHAGITEVARQLDLPRGTVRSRMRTIREHFHRAGLHDYVSTVRQSADARRMETVGAALGRASREDCDA